MNKWRKYGLAAAMAAAIGMVGAGISASAGTAETVKANQNEIVLGAQKTADRDSSADASDSSAESSGASSSDISSSDGDLSIADVAEQTMPSMVAITNTSVETIQKYFDRYGGWNGNSYSANGQSANDFYNYFFGNGGNGNGFGGNDGGNDDGSGNGSGYESISMGTGIIVARTDDYVMIATNAHVISGADKLSVAFADESAASAEVVGSDSSSDLAVIRVKVSDLDKSTLEAIKVISIGSSDKLRVGEQVVAIGNALGYGQSVSSGIVSALNRSIETQDEETGKTETTEGMIQTDASINPGNSGGALLNMKGELIGINSAKYEDESVEGMGYAIPIDYALPILQNLANGKGSDGSSSSNGSVTLGITCVTVTESEAKQYNAPQGVYVYSVTEGSAADNAGLQKGDIITGFNDKEITTVEELKSALADCKEGDSVKLTVERQAQDAFSSGATSYQKGTLTVTFGTDSTSESTDSSSDESEQPA